MSNIVRINFMGDINLGAMLENYKRGVSGKIQKKKINPFSYVSDHLNDGDINVCNLECVLSDTSDKLIPFSEVMRAPVDFIRILKENNIHLVNLANNHTMDHGLQAFNEMRSALNEAGIKIILDNYTFHEEENVIISINGLSVGFIGYYIEETINAEEYSVLITRIHKELALISESCDKVVLSLHWGHEYTSNPMSWQINLAKELIDSNNKLSVIYGHHSHTLNGIIKYNNCVFAPSLGNFVFDDCLKRNRITGILNVSISDSNLDYSLIPCFINKNYQPEANIKYKAYANELSNELQNAFFATPETDGAWDKKIRRQSKKGHNLNRIKVRFWFLINLLFHYRDLKPLLIQRNGR